MTPVIQIVQHFKPGGIETLVLDFLAHPPVGHSTFAVSLEGDIAQALKAWPRLRPFADRMVFLGKKPGIDLRIIVELVRLFRRLRPGAVHTHHVGPLLYGGLAARLAGIGRLVHTEHDAWHLDDPRRARLMWALVSILRPRVIADSRMVAERFREVIGKSAFGTVVNGIDTDHFSLGDRKAARRELGLAADCPIIGSAGRLEPVKGHDVLLRAFAGMKNASVCLAIAGDGSQKTRLQSLAKALGIESRVWFLGRVDDMPRFYQALDLFCLPSRHEGLPLSLFEAQACGVPVIATNVGGSAEAVCPSTGLLVPSEDTICMAAAMDQAVSQTAPCSPRRFALDRGDLHLMLGAYAEALT